MMNAAVYTEDLQSLQAILQDWLDGIPLDFHCTSQAGALTILGQHSAELHLESHDLLRQLERRIQSLQLRFVQQARLYLRVAGESRPYAQRFFLIQPPPPPPPPRTPVGGAIAPGSTTGTSDQATPAADEALWAVSDAELDDLVNELVGDLEALPFHPMPPAATLETTDAWTLATAVDAAELAAPATEDMVLNLATATSPEPEALVSPTADAPAIDFDAWVAPASTEATDAATAPAPSPESLSLIPWEGDTDALTDAALAAALAGEMDGTLLSPLVPAPRAATTTAATGLSARTLVAGGAIALGVVGGVYGLSRPCVVGACPELQTAQELEQAAVQQAAAATDVEDLTAAQSQLQRAIATLETIPPWSGRSGRAQTQRDTQATHAMTLGTLTEVARVAQTARDRSQDAPLSVTTWNRLIAPLATAIERLDGISPASPFYATAQRHQQQYAAQLQGYERQRALELEAQEVLNMARQGIEMAEARQQIAQTKEQWQLVRITWQVVVNRLHEVPAETYAAIEAARLLQSYEPRLDAAIAQMQREATAAERLSQANTYAQQAEAAANQFNWQGAIAAWTNAIRETRQIPPGTALASQGETLAQEYQSAIEAAQTQLDHHLAISLDIDRACNGEFRKCRLVAVSEEVRVQLSTDYLAAIAAARESGNRDLQAVVTEHQLELRRTLQDLAAEFRLPIAVYDTDDNLLDRHHPNANTV